jgi:hypothetical protein
MLRRWSKPKLSGITWRLYVRCRTRLTIESRVASARGRMERTKYRALPSRLVLEDELRCGPEPRRAPRGCGGALQVPARDMGQVCLLQSSIHGGEG